ncbi:MAG TPA: abortive infection family protein [Kofleriaceae bacterium]|jgi:hypothetical protein
MSDDLDEKLNKLRSVVNNVEEHDQRLRAQTLELSATLAAECRRGHISFHGEDFVIEEGVDDIDLYGYVYVDSEGIGLAYRSQYEDVEDHINGIPREERTYRLSRPDAWPVQWLRRVVTEQRLAGLIDGLSKKAEALAEGHAVLSERVGRANQKPNANIEEGIRAVATEFGFSKVMQDWAEAQRAVFQSPDAAMRAASVLLETTLKHIYKNRGIELPSDKSIGPLYATLMKQVPPLIAGDRAAGDDVAAMIRGLAGVVQNIGALRTKLGDAHGKSPGQATGGLDEARLAVDAAGAASVYLIRKLAKPPAT